MTIDLNLASTKELMHELAERCNNIVILRETTSEKEDSYQMSSMKYYFSFGEDFLGECYDGDAGKAAATMMSKAVYDILRGEALSDDDSVDKFKLDT